MKKKNLLGFILYDFANSSFTTVIVTVVFAVYFKDYIVGNAIKGTALWGRAISISMASVAVLGPILGAVADHCSLKKTMMMVFTYLSIAFTALLYFPQKGDILFAMLVFIVANFGYNAANIFYNAFLNEVAKTKELGKVSGWAWGIGYLGGLLSLVLVKPFQGGRLTFPIVALFFFIFSLFTFLLLKEKKTAYEKINYFTIAYRRIKESIMGIKKLPELVKYLISYFLYNDGIVVVIAFASIFASETLKMTLAELTVFFILMQITAFLGAVSLGYAFDKLGAKKAINFTLFIWLLVILGAYLCQTKQQFYVVGFLAGLAMGSSQSCSRSLLTLLTPSKKVTEFFGFYSTTGRFSSVLGPLVYGEVARITGSQRLSVLSISLFIVLGGIIFQFVDIKKGISAAKDW